MAAKNATPKAKAKTRAKTRAKAKPKTRAKAKPKTAAKGKTRAAKTNEVETGLVGARGGAVVKYTADMPERALNLALLGLTDTQVAAVLGVSRQTLYNWRADHPEFDQSFEDGRLTADGKVVRSLYERATGYEYLEQVPIKLKEVTYENGKRVKEVERVEVVEILRKVAPDTTAQIFWLKNRRADQWRDKPDGAGPLLLIPLKEVSNKEIAERLIAYESERDRPSSIIDGTYTTLES